MRDEKQGVSEYNRVTVKMRSKGRHSRSKALKKVQTHKQVEEVQELSKSSEKPDKKPQRTVEF